MDELNDTLCAVIFGATNCSIDTVTQLGDGAYLPHILEKIDPEAFKADDPSLANWKTVQDRLEAYLESKGIKDRGLELPIQELEERDYDSTVSAVLQILAIFVTFNKAGWDNVMKTLDFVTRTHITKLLEGMVASLRQLVELSQKMQKFGPDDLNLAGLLSKLELKEEELEKRDAELAKVRAALAAESALRTDLAGRLKEKERELLDMQELKERAYEDLIRNQAGLGDEFETQKAAKAMRDAEKEIADLKNKLSTAQTSSIDRDLEISKLNSLIATLTVSHNQNEDLRRQLEHYERSTKEIRVQNEYLNSRINSMSNVDGLIKGLNAKLREEKEGSLKLQAQLQETQPLLEKLQKRIDLLESQKRFSGGQAGGATEFSDLHSLELFRNLEFENQQYKKRLEELMATNRQNEERLFSQAILERENEALRAQIDAFLASGDLNVFKRPRNVEEDAANGMELSEQLLKTGQGADKKFVSLDQLPTTDFSADAHPRGRSTPNFGEYADVLYTTLMEFYTGELADQKKFVLPRHERERNILKQFMLTDMLQGE